MRQMRHSTTKQVRGNHDAMSAKFPRSQAQYVTRQLTLDVKGIRICVLPFSRGRVRRELPSCDVLVTHVPPKGVLDRCYNGDHAGSRFLRGSSYRLGGALTR